VRLKLLKTPQLGFIEYIPGEFAWRPVEARGCLFIHCLWAVGQSRGKGFASALLEKCMANARRSNRDGVAMVVSDLGYMKWKRFLVKHGFDAVDVASPCHELMALHLRAANQCHDVALPLQSIPFCITFSSSIFEYDTNSFFC